GAISLGVRIENDLLQIDFTTSQFPIDELSEVLKAYRSKRKYYRMKNGSFVNIEDSSLFELSSVLDTLHLSDKQLAKGKIKLPTYHALSLDNSLKNTQSLKVDRDHNFKAIIRDIKNIQDSDYEVPASMKPILRNYQKSGYRWLKTMAAYGFGAILADDMGIGKTIQVITLLEDEKIHNPKSTSIVVCPTSLILNWESEIHKFSKILNPLVINGNANQRKQQLKKSMDYDIVITSYDYLKRDYCFLDEAQYIKNHTTKNAESVKEINSLHKFALTGTPIENSLAELWSIFDFLMPGYLYTYSAFKKNYEIAIVKDSDQDALNELKKLVEPFILRRIKKDVLQELPEKVENTLHVDLDEEAQKLYSANLLSMKDELQESISKDGEKHGKIMVLSMLTKLRQICCDPHLVYDDFAGESAKLLACMELIENAAASKKKVLIFSQFTSLLSIIENKLVENDISYYLLKGSTPKTLRQQMVSSFNNDDTQVFLISLKAGGTGLNLTSAEVVIHFDPWWNVSAQNQATDRAYRMGQHNNVQVYKLIAKNTIEEKIQELQDLKKDLSDSIINENNGLIHDMSTEELIGLLN
ncbi:MAG: DEAD/DEAH box helicase, partial [Erysipelotrichaceae bacterium]